MENQVGLVRERFFTPRLRGKSYDEVNAWLLDRCVAYAQAHRHPELTDQTIWEVFEAERPKLIPYVGRFVPVLARKPGALRNGAPFKDWVFPAAWSACGARWPVPPTEIGRWSTS